MKEKKDWLNNFIERNAWGILVALIGVTVAYTSLKFEVKAHDGRIHTIEEAQIVNIQNQKDIIELQTIQKTVTDDIGEIKGDVKELLKR